MDDSGAIRAGLLAAIRDRRKELEAAGERAEAERNLPSGTMGTLRELGAFWLKTPAELGGTPLDPLDFCDVLEEFAYTDGATAWAVMVGNGGTGTAGGWLPDAGARRVFVPGRPLPLVMGTPGPRGTGRPSAGGYLVSGQWSFASGCGHADWLIGGFRSAGPDGRPMVAVVPREQATVIDNWRVAGLRGSGSFDFRLEEVFVPAELTFGRAASACRGGALFNVEAHVFLSNELPPGSPACATGCSTRRGGPRLSPSPRRPTPTPTARRHLPSSPRTGSPRLTTCCGRRASTSLRTSTRCCTGRCLPGSSSSGRRPPTASSPPSSLSGSSAGSSARRTARPWQAAVAFGSRRDQGRGPSPPGGGD